MWLRRGTISLGNSVNVVRQTEILSADPLVFEISALRVEMAS